MKYLKKGLIALGVLTIILAGLFYIFQDNADTEKIAKEQETEAKVASVDMSDDLNASFDEE